MKRLTLRIHARGLAGTALASLRVVGLMYTSLAGILALTLIVSVALLPATEPARQMVSGLVQPTTDAVSGFMSGPGLTWLPEPAVAASPMSGVDVQAAIGLTAGYTSLVDSAADQAERADLQVDAVDEPVALEAPVQAIAAAPVYRSAAVRAPVAVEEADTAVDEDGQEAEPAPTPVVSEPTPDATPLAVPAERAVLVVANQAPPKALPTLARPTETAQQVKDRLDVENQAAIDAGKAAQVRAKADADTANQRAITARQASEASLAQARTQSDIANQAAIDTAKGTAVPVKVTPPTPTA